MTTKLTKKKWQEMAITKAKAELLSIMERHNHKVYTKLYHVSQSGMLRSIGVFVKNEEGYMKDITDLVATALDYKLHKTGGIKMTGCGMDMGFALVYNLSTALYKNENGSYSHDGAYKLKQQWI